MLRTQRYILNSLFSRGLDTGSACNLPLEVANVLAALKVAPDEFEGMEVRQVAKTDCMGVGAVEWAKRTVCDEHWSSSAIGMKSPGKKVGPIGSRAFLNHMSEEPIPESPEAQSS